MKSLIAILFIFSFVLTVNAQGTFTGDNRIKVHAYIGGPSLSKTLFKFSGELKEKISYTNTPLFGGNLEIYLSNWFSLGAELNYRNSRIGYEIVDSTLFQEFKDKLGIDLNELSDVDILGKYTLEFQRLRILAKATAHFLPEAEHSDLFFSIGFGYNGLNYQLMKEGKEIGFSEKIPRLSLPVSFRASLGYSYYFIPNLAITGEFGVISPLLTIGLSGRF